MNERAQLIAYQTYAKVAGKPVAEFTRYDWERVAKDLKAQLERGRRERPLPAGESDDTLQRMAKHIAAGAFPDEAARNVYPESSGEDREAASKLGWLQYVIDLAERRRDGA
jgi:hypothetical protein